MKSKLIYFLLLISLLLTSCFEEDEPLAPYNGKVSTIKYHIEYFQSYYDFETDSIWHYHNSDAWTLGFSCNEAETWVITNSGGHWFVLNTHLSDINASFNFPEKFIWDYDQQSFFPDSLAINNWITISGNDTIYSNNVFLVGKFNGTIYSDIFRVQFLKVDDNKFIFCYNSNSTTETPDTITISKSQGKNFIYFSFDDFSVKDLEPAKQDYDVIFGPYYDIVTQLGVTAPYLVRGVLIKNGSLASIDSLHTFKDITLENIADFDFTAKRNIIGHMWKEVNIDPSSNNASYSIREDYNYLIKTSDGNYYKFRFLSYSLDGEDGYPSFEAEKLN